MAQAKDLLRRPCHTGNVAPDAFRFDLRYPSSMPTATTAPLAPIASPLRRIPGNKGIWVGITCELVEFTVMFVIYFIARSHYPEEFHQGADRLWLAAGTVITLLMVSSSFLVACSVTAISQGRQKLALLLLSGALVIALGYPVTKAMEVSWNLDHGLNGSAGIFITVYYYLTFNHLVHASWGIIGMIWVLARLAIGAYSAENHDGLEALASYWHATDIIWLVIFPLFYVLA